MFYFSHPEFDNYLSNVYCNILFDKDGFVEDIKVRMIFTDTLAQIINVWEPPEYVTRTEGDHFINKFIQKVFPIFSAFL